MKLSIYLSALAAAVVIITGGVVMAADLTVTVANTTHGMFFTPLLITAHSEDFRLFEPGQPVTAALRAMAEGGDLTALSQLAGGADEDTVINPALGLLAPGQSITMNLNTDLTGNDRLSLAAMMLPTNDGFVGLDSLVIPQTPGIFTFDLNAFDAGTEINDELVADPISGTPGIPGIPRTPEIETGVNGTGASTVETNTTVHIHRGTLGDYDPDGGVSDLDMRVHRWLNPVGQLIIEVN